MKTNRKVLGLVSALFGLLLLFVAVPSFAQCGPGGAGCQGCTGTCTGVACAIPGQHTPSPGTCTAAQLAGGAIQLNNVSNCAGSLAGVCRCYLPSFFQIIQQNCARVSLSSITWDTPDWDEPKVLARSEKCAKAELSATTPATSTALVAVADEKTAMVGAS